jgi:hypothetical protein
MSSLYDLALITDANGTISSLLLPGLSRPVLPLPAEE